MKIASLITVVGIIVSFSSYAQQKKATGNMDFNPAKYEVQTLTYKGKELNIRAYEKIVYVANPVDTTYQILNFYVPEEYYSGKTINGYNASTAPIFFPNQIGGYMPGFPASTKNNNFVAPLNGGVAPVKGDVKKMAESRSQPGKQVGGMMDGKRENTVLAALTHGYVVASAGARGRTNKDNNGKYYGKAPAGLVDLKAAVRYLKYNDKAMPGDANKIISNGTSAGGAMSALLGSTGNNPDYFPYLKEIGAADTSDDIFASSDYCPIINLENADAAYEWQFNGITSYSKGGPFGNGTESNLSDSQIKISSELKSQFPAYVNSLKLKDENGIALTLNERGNGTFKDFIKNQVITSANIALKAGTGLSEHSFLMIKEDVVQDLNWEDYIKYMQRQKTPPAFDALDLSSPETNVFGTDDIDNQHFTNFGQANNKAANGSLAEKEIVKMYNPMLYIGLRNTTVAKYFRIRHGAKDKDTSLAISALMAIYLRNHGTKVDYALPWDRPHSGDYDLPELFRWIDEIVQNK